jgi:hypothetical protein
MKLTKLLGPRGKPQLPQHDNDKPPVPGRPFPKMGRTRLPKSSTPGSSRFGSARLPGPKCNSNIVRRRPGSCHWFHRGQATDIDNDSPFAAEAGRGSVIVAVADPYLETKVVVDLTTAQNTGSVAHQHV